MERGHGRIKRRTCTLMSGVHGLRDELDLDRRWTDLGCAVRVVAERTRRGHWRVPSGRGNSLHWVLNDTFQEDRCCLTGHAAHNMAALRRIALNFLTLMHQYFWSRMSIRRLRKMVARNPAQTGADHSPVTTLSMS